MPRKTKTEETVVTEERALLRNASAETGTLPEGDSPAESETFTDGETPADRNFPMEGDMPEEPSPYGESMDAEAEK